MKRYSLGSHALIDSFKKNYNQNNQFGYVFYDISGILMDGNFNFTAVVEYFELDVNESFSIPAIKNDIFASVIVAHRLKLPLFIIVYKEKTDYFEIFDFFNNISFTKSIIHPTPNNCEFLQWWKQYKGTQQYKPFYNNNYLSWKINQVFNTGVTKWGGDVDGIIMDNQRIISLVEFRKSTYETVDKYNPLSYYKGTQNRAGDYMTWLPLILLKKALNSNLYLVTLSEVDTSHYGIAEILDNDQSNLYLKFDVTPFETCTDNIDFIFNILSNRIH